MLFVSFLYLKLNRSWKMRVHGLPLAHAHEKCAYLHVTSKPNRRHNNNQTDDYKHKMKR